MGQYYRTIILEDGVILAWLAGCRYMSGIKLMEHSYINDNFIKIVEELISPEGKYYKKQLVWAGDYAPWEENLENNLYELTKEKEDLEIPSLFQQKNKRMNEISNKISLDEMLKDDKLLEEALKNEETKLYLNEYMNLSAEFKETQFLENPKKYYRYIINHTKKLYVDKENSLNQIKNINSHNNIVHPLPLLVCEGDKSGHDFWGNNNQLCGTWSRDCISVDNSIPEGFIELVPNFYE